MCLRPFFSKMLLNLLHLHEDILKQRSPTQRCMNTHWIVFIVVHGTPLVFGRRYTDVYCDNNFTIRNPLERSEILMDNYSDDSDEHFLQLVLVLVFQHRRVILNTVVLMTTIIILLFEGWTIMNDINSFIIQHMRVWCPG